MTSSTAPPLLHVAPPLSRQASEAMDDDTVSDQFATDFLGALAVNEQSRYTMRYTSPVVESAYEASHWAHGRLRARNVLLGSALVYFAFAFSDIARFEDDYHVLLPLRFTICFVAIVAAVTSHFGRERPKLAELMISCAALVALSLTVVISWIQVNSLEDSSTTGLVLVLASMSVLLRLSFVASVTTSLAFLLGWAVASIVVVARDQGNDEVGDSLYNLVIVIFSAIVFLMATYESEMRGRAQFLLETKLRCEHHNAMKENRALKEELHELRTGGSKLDMDSPAEKVIQALERVRSYLFEHRDDSGAEVHLDDIDFSVRTLNSTASLYAPDLTDQVHDSVTRAWLVSALKQRPLLEPSTPSGLARNISEAMLTERGGDIEMPTLPTMSQLDLEREVKALGDWGFDVYNLAETTAGGTLQFVTYEILKAYNLVNDSMYGTECLRPFLAMIEAGYRPENAYHNALHGSDVVQTCHWLMHEGGMRSHFKRADLFSLIIAACAHDFDHPGTTNAFQVASGSDLAVLYNDRAVLENHHAAGTFRIMQEEKCDILSGLSQRQRSIHRKLIIDLILATDLSSHFELVGQFKTMIKARAYDESNEDDRMLLLKMVLKCGDISNPAKPYDVMRKATECYFTECYLQGDKERAMGMPVSAFMDREAKCEAKCEVGFISFLVKPLYDAMSDFQGGKVTSVALKTLEGNEVFWKEEAAKEAAAIEAAEKKEKKEKK